MQNDKKSPLNQSLWGKIYQVIITWIVYFLFRPKVEWVDKSVKKQLKGKPAVFVLKHTHISTELTPARCWGGTSPMSS